MSTDTIDSARIVQIATALRQAIERCPKTKLPWENFPRGACGDTTLVLGQLLFDHGIAGFKYISGQKHWPDGRFSTHAWLQNGQWVVDITADQFPEVQQAIIVSSDSPWHREWEVAKTDGGALSEYKAEQVVQQWHLYGELKARLAI